MTEVFFTLNADHKITGFKTLGHAGYKRRGKDIVCSAISALTITAVNSIEEVAKADAEVITDEKTGMISLKLRSLPDDRTETIFRSLILGLKGISAEYEGRYCKVTIKEELQC
ncbi:MAG: ribosomal-processing cysteine protease Prp [Lachnospiraceae bacterium]|nr:ribosomal-processing cysteine protease Prp [Lachnospiraceae bacterium]